MWLKFEKKILKVVRAVLKIENIENCACRFEKTCFEKNAFKVSSWVWETPDTPQEKREIKQTIFFFSCMKPFVSYFRRFKLNLKPKKNRFSEKFTLVLPLKVILTMEHYIKLLTIFIWKFAIFWSWQHALGNLAQFPHSTVILKEYFENITLKSCNIAKIFIKLLERFLKYCRHLAMYVQNIINGILLQY